MLVAETAGKQVARRGVGEPSSYCLLLLLDDRDNFGIDEDGVWSPVDLGLRVVESRDLLAFGSLDGASGRGREAVELAHAYLTCPPTSQYLQQQHSHRLRITAARQLTLGVTDADHNGFGGVGTQCRQAGHDLGQRIIVHVVLVIQQRGGSSARDLPSPDRRMRIGEVVPW